MIIVSCMGYDPATVLEVTQNSAADKAGLKKGDVITEYQATILIWGKISMYIRISMN